MIKIFLGLLILTAYHQLGLWLMTYLQWPIPGSVVGMLLLFVSLLSLKKPPESVVKSSEFLLRHLALLFVPAGVGIMLLFELIADQWLAMLVSMVVSTFISLLFTAWLMQGLISLSKNGEPREP